MSRRFARASLRLFGAPLLLGAVAGLGRPGIDLAPLFFGSEVGIAYLAMRSASLVEAACLGLSWGIGLFSVISLGTLSWGVIVPVALTLIGIALYAVPFALWAWWGPRRFQPRLLFVATAAVWALWMELGDALRFPLKLSAESLVAAAPVLASGARLVGANWLSGILAATWLGVARALLRGREQPRLARLLGVLPVFAAGFGLLAALAGLAQVTAADSRRSVQVGVPQINASSVYYTSRLLRPELARDFDTRFQALLRDLDGVDLLVTTEGYDGRFGLMLPTVLDGWQRYARAHQQAVLLTSYTVEANGWKGNAIAGISATGQLVGVHRKVDLAFYGERPMAAGSDYRVLPVRPDLVVGAAICLESLLPGAPRTMTRLGANLLAVSTSDITFGSNVTAFEHLASTQLRAIEVGRSIVWASNGGPSGVIDRWGEFQATAPFREAAGARMAAPLHDDMTFFLRHSNALIVAALLALVGLRAAQRDKSLELGPGESLTALPSRSTLRTWLLAASCVLATVTAVLAGPALVEASRGKAARAEWAIADALKPHLTFAPPDAFARFRTTPEQSARGALAYFLSYYGVESTARDLPATPDGLTSLTDLQSYLQSEFSLGTHSVALDARALPRVAMLVRLRSGTYGVLTDPTGEELPTLFSPMQAQSRALQRSQLTEVLEPGALIPMARPEP